MMTLGWILVVVILSVWGVIEFRLYLKRADESAETNLIEETNREYEEWVESWTENELSDTHSELSREISLEIQAMVQWDQWIEQLAGQSDEELVERLNELGFDVTIDDLPPQDREVIVKRGQIRARERQVWVDGVMGTEYGKGRVE